MTVSELYERVSPAIDGVCYNVSRRRNYPDVEELRSEADVVFARMARREPDRVADTIGNHVRCRLSDFIDKQPAARPLPQLLEAREVFDLGLLLSEVSDDARTVIGVALDWRAPGRGKPRANAPRTPREYVIRTLHWMGWPAWRVAAVFAEVAEALA